MKLNKKVVTRKRPLNRTRRRRVTVAKPKVSQAVKSYVNRTISAKAENKVFVDYGINLGITAHSGGSVPTHRNLLPQLTQGITAQQRIGNEVRVKSAIIRGAINLLPYNSVTNTGSNPQYVMIWLLKNKKDNIVLTSSQIGTTMFELGNSCVGLQGNMLDTLLPINNLNWNCLYKRKYKLGASATIGGNISGSPDNSSFSIPFVINYSRHLKVLKYEDGSLAHSHPVNTNINMVFTAVYADGSITSQFIPAEYHFTNTIYYEDM